MSRCRGCDAEVVFVPSAKSGKPMILDAKPTKGVAVIDATSGAVLEGRLREFYLEGGGAPGESDRMRAAVVDVFTDHHATCPEAARFRRMPSPRPTNDSEFVREAQRVRFR